MAQRGMGSRNAEWGRAEWGRDLPFALQILSHRDQLTI